MSSTLYRAYSSPNIKGKLSTGVTQVDALNRALTIQNNQTKSMAKPARQSPSEREYQQYKHRYETEDDEFYVIGDRVYVDGYKAASVAYFGDVEFSSGDWVGVVLDNPLGNHNGKVHGREYFQCAPLHGLFVRPHRISRMPDSALGSSASSSRVSTPIHRLSSRASKSPGSSTVDSYFYDEDYKVPTVASLERKLRSIEMRPPSRMGDSSSKLPPAGILKRYGSRSSESPITTRTEVSGVRTQTNRSSSHTPTTVFNFRPKRTPLDQLESPTGQSGVVFDLSSRPPRLGDRVSVQSERGPMTGLLRFVGETNFATGEWAGIELDLPDGKNDGSVLDHRYFYCPKNHGLFVPATRIRALNESQVSKPEFNSMRSTIKSPPPKSYTTRANVNRSTTPMSYEENTRSQASDGSYSNQANSPAESSISDDKGADMYDIFDEYFGKTSESRGRPKFDDREIEIQLRRSLNRPTAGQKSINQSSQHISRQPIPKAVKYTFSSSKYDGNPIARRTLQYD